jgi:hypothetical protein
MWLPGLRRGILVRSALPHMLQYRDSAGTLALQRAQTKGSWGSFLGLSAISLDMVAIKA